MRLKLLIVCTANNKRLTWQKKVKGGIEIKRISLTLWQKKRKNVEYEGWNPSHLNCI